MSFMKSGAILGSLLLAASALSISPAQAQDYPSRSIRLVVPYSPGGANDTVARILAQKLTDSLGQNVVVDNRPGASGMIAGEFVSKAPPDGYTIMVDLSSITLNPALYPNITYDVRTDLSPIMRAVNVLHIFLVNSALPVRNMKELIAYAKANPGKLNYCSPGTGGPQHVDVEQLKRLTGIDVVHVPYKGGAPALQAIVANDVQFGFFAVSTSLPQIRAGKLRPIAVSGDKRLDLFPDVPTFAEQGFSGITTPWLGVFAPGKTPAPIIKRLQAELAKALTSPDVREKLAVQGLEASPSTTAEFVKQVNDEIATYGKVIRESGIKVE
ncbi:MAG TPA: tripartite tricarboxylate transporter substrate binding protein [Usitatibacter sp.]